MKALFLAKHNFNFRDFRCNNGGTGIDNLISILRSISEVYTSPYLYDQCVELGIMARKLELAPDRSGNTYVQDIDFMVSQALDKGVDILVAAGGDGTASYVASSAIMNGSDKSRPVLLGFPAGTANAGPIVHPLGTGETSGLRQVELDAIEVTDGDNVIGYGFNDVIIGNSFLATLDGKMVNLDARAMTEYDGHIVVRPGERITGSDFSVRLDGKEAFIPHKVVQICVSAVNSDIPGSRAVLGGLLNAVGDAHSAAAAFIDRIMVDSDPASWKWRGPISTTHICFTQDNILEISGFGEDAQIIVDGNPFIRRTDRLSFRIVPHACTALWGTGV